MCYGKHIFYTDTIIAVSKPTKLFFIVCVVTKLMFYSRPLFIACNVCHITFFYVSFGQTL